MRNICEIILDLDPWFRRSCRLKRFIIYSSGGQVLFSGLDRLCNCVIGHYEELFCEINLNWWFSRRLSYLQL